MSNTASSYGRRKVVMLVIGATGSGKSTFINLISDSRLPVSSKLTSCTQEVTEGNSFVLDGQEVLLIDTPGLDDTDRSDVDILQSIVAALVDLYRKGVLIHGVLYFHRISDLRMSGTSKRSFELCRKLCGDEFMKNTVIVTNMWNIVPYGEARARERQLAADARFFRPALDSKARMHRHDNTLRSAQKAIRLLLTNRPAPLLVQRELIDEGRRFNNTSVGTALRSYLHDLARRKAEELSGLSEELAQAEQDHDLTAIMELRLERERMFASLQQIQLEEKTLGVVHGAHREQKTAVRWVRRMQRLVGRLHAYVRLWRIF